MDKLIAYLNSLSKPDRTTFAKSCGTSEGYMRKARSAGQKFRSELCVRIETQSNKVVRRQDLRDDWAEIWPELVVEPAAPDASDDVQPPVGSLDDPKDDEEGR